MEEIFKISTNEGCASDSWRALLFSPTRDGVDLLLHHLPFKTEYVDPFTDEQEAMEALLSGKYRVLIADITMYDTVGKELIQIASANHDKIKAFCVAHSRYSTVSADSWKVGKNGFFYHIGSEQDAFSIPLMSLFSHDSSLKWVGNVKSEFMSMRKEINGTPGEVVLIKGAPGTGKYCLSQLAHSKSSRNAYRFLFANCNSDDEDGHVIWGKAEKDSFRNNLKSMFSAAEKGTLYFHEIEKLDYEAQEILADVLLSSLATRAPKGERRFNGLVICSTSSVLENRVSDKIFSENLYRIITRHVMNIPSITDFKSDIEPMATELLDIFCVINDRAHISLSKESYKKLAGHVWSWNIRELFHVLRHAATVTTRKKIKPDDIVLTPNIDKFDTDHDKARLIKQALRESRGNKAKAASTLRVSRKTLYKWMELYNIPMKYR